MTQLPSYYELTHWLKTHGYINYGLHIYWKFHPTLGIYSIPAVPSSSIVPNSVLKEIAERESIELSFLINQINEEYPCPTE